MKKKLIIFTLYDENTASSRYRMYMFKEDLGLEFDVHYFSFWSYVYASKYMKDKKKYILPIIFSFFLSFIKRVYQIFFIASRADYVIFQKSVFPKLNINLIDFLKKRRVKVIFDIDDSVYLYDRGASESIARKVDKVIVGNSNLYSYYSKLTHNVIIIPTTDYTPFYEMYWTNTFENKKIGWIGQKSSIKNLDLIINPLNELITKHPNLEFLIICDDDYGYTQKIKNSRLILWDPDTYIKELSRITVGVMPLENNEFNAGKCGFKLIQYMNLKKPVCASDIGENRNIVKDCGKMCRNEDEWMKSLEELLFNQNEYEACIKNIESSFFERYEYRKILKLLVDNIKG